jgi:hypothetical protein
VRANSIHRLRATVLLLGLALGCGQKEPSTPDAGVNEDAGIEFDAGSRPDAGPVPDAGPLADAGPVDPDAGTDAGTDPNADPNYPPCATPYLGNPQAPADFIPTALGPQATALSLVEGGGVSIIEPPQGGRVSFVGVRGVINMDPCGIYLSATFRDPVTRQIRYEGRTVTLRRDEGGTGASTDADISTFSNVPLCPNQWSGQDIFDQEYELEIALYDRRDRYLAKTLRVRPACDVPGEAAMCRCICKKGYRLGQPCP